MDRRPPSSQGLGQRLRSHTATSCGCPSTGLGPCASSHGQLTKPADFRVRLHTSRTSGPLGRGDQCNDSRQGPGAAQGTLGFPGKGTSEASQNPELITCLQLSSSADCPCSQRQSRWHAHPGTGTQQDTQGASCPLLPSAPLRNQGVLLKGTWGSPGLHCLLQVQEKKPFHLLPGLT